LETVVAVLFTGRMTFLSQNQQRQRTEGNDFPNVTEHINQKMKVAGKKINGDANLNTRHINNT